MIETLFIILFAMSIGFMVYSLKSKTIVWSILATILFFTCAFSSFNIEVVTNTGEIVSITEPIYIYISWLFAFISFVITLIAVVSYLKEGRNIM